MAELESGENKRKHLELIQGVVTRMAGNLFYLKGWTVTLIVGLFALAAKDTEQSYFVIAYFVAFFLWLLDGYFLWQERLFRSLYDNVRKLNEKDIDFSMSTESFRSKKGNNLLASMFSTTLFGFYLPLIVVMSFIVFFIK